MGGRGFSTPARATFEATAPGSSSAATIRSFSARDHTRRRCTDVNNCDKYHTMYWLGTIISSCLPSSESPSFQERRSSLWRMFKRSNDRKTGFAESVYVVSATSNDQSDFWAAATSRRMAAAKVQQLLPPGWTATSTGWRLSAARAGELKIRPNTVRRIT